MNANQHLQAAIDCLAERGKQYDNPEGERSMEATVTAFEAVTGHSLTVTQGWLFMALLKAVRTQQGDYKADSFIDGAAYFALAGESAAQAAPATRQPSPDDWEAGEARMDVVGQNGPTAEHYPKTGFIDGYGAVEIGDYLPELGGYLIGFIDDCGIIMLDGVGERQYSYNKALEFVSEFNCLADESSGEFNDWRVPTKDELNLAWVNRDRLIELDMSLDIYWSSTESTAGLAWCQAFDGGGQVSNGRDGSYRVRPVRTVPVDQLAGAKE